MRLRPSYLPLVAIGALFLPLSASCRSAPRVAPSGAVIHLTDTHSIRLLDPSGIDRPFEAYHGLEGAYGERRFVFDAFVTADPDHLSIIALNGFGAEALSLDYTRDGVRIGGAFASSVPKPEYIVADFQLCYYAEGVLRTELERAGLGFEETRIGATLRRRVLDAGTVIIEIERTATGVSYRNLLRGYGYEIRSGEAE